ncbi:MAG: hypothetical protein R3F39_07335 [Myxococcota bacterium]
MLIPRFLLPAMLAGLLGLVSACDGGGDNTVVVVSVCAQGETQACTCAGGTTSAQTCNAAKDGWLPCECGVLADTTVADAGTDTPDATPDVPSDSGPDLEVNPDVAPSVLSVTLENADGQTVSSLAAMHKVGDTACPQRLGTIVAVNGTASPATLTLSVPQGVAISFSPSATANVAAGATTKIDANFTCANTDGIDTTLTVAFSNQAASADTSFPLALAVDAPDPCGLITCDQPPAPDCDGKVARTYEKVGTCSAEGGVATCSYAFASQTTCPTDCAAGACLAAPNPFDYVFAPKASFVTKLGVASEGCCFDYDGDGKDDNGLQQLLGLLAQFVDVDLDTLLQDSIDSGELVMLFEHRGLQNVTNQTSMNLRTVIGRHLSSVAAAKAGTGTFEASAEFFSPSTGTPMSDVSGKISGGFLQVGPGNGVVKLRVSASVSTGANGQGLTMTGGNLAGIVPLAFFADAMNGSVKSCACLGAGGSPIVQLISTDPKKLKLGCTAAFNAATPNCSAQNGEVCMAFADNKSLICPALGILPIDQDTDGDGQKDSISVGFTFSAVSADIVGVY